MKFLGLKSVWNSAYNISRHRYGNLKWKELWPVETWRSLDDKFSAILSCLLLNMVSKGGVEWQSFCFLLEIDSDKAGWIAALLWYRHQCPEFHFHFVFAIHVVTGPTWLHCSNVCWKFFFGDKICNVQLHECRRSN